MEIRIRESGAVVFEQEFRRLHPNTSFPPVLTVELLNDYGADPVLEGAQPTGDQYQYAQRQGVEQVDGQWFTKYVIGPVFSDFTDTDGVTHTAAEQEAEYKARKDAEQATGVRSTRDAKLAETDWRFRSDMNPSQEWIDYCQALRDIPEQDGFPWSINWPTQPAQANK